MYMKRNKRLEIENKIKEFCTNESKKLKEIQIFTGLNIHTLRAHYLYKMVKDGSLKRKRNGYYKSS